MFFLWTQCTFQQQSQAARQRQHCVNSDQPVNWTWRILTPYGIETPEPTVTKFGNYVHKRTP